MYAVTLTGFGGPEVMMWSQVPDLHPGHGQVLIDVAAAGVNRADVFQRKGLYPPQPGVSEIMGLECAGTIAEVGEGVHGWKRGDQVCALVAGGAYAEQVVAPATQLLPVPMGLDVCAAAALPEVAATVWWNVVMIGRLHSGQLVLVHGGASGIGMFAIQVARSRGAAVAVTAGSQYKLDRCRELGADILINYKETDFVAAVHDRRGGADLILDNMGAAYLSRNVKALATDGQLIVIGMQGGVAGDLPLDVLQAKCGLVRSTSLRSRPETGRSSKAEIIAEMAANLWPLITEGTISPVISAEVPISEVRQAHELLDGPQTVGKVVLRVR